MYVENNLFAVMSHPDNLSLNLFLVYFGGFSFTISFNPVRFF